MNHADPFFLVMIVHLLLIIFMMTENFILKNDIKNQMFSLEIINRIRREYPEAVLTFVGYSMDQYENKIYKKIDQYGLKNNVEFYPGDADTLTLLSRTDAFLLPSLYEGFGIVLIEAQAVGYLLCVRYGSRRN